MLSPQIFVYFIFCCSWWLDDLLVLRSDFFSKTWISWLSTMVVSVISTWVRISAINSSDFNLRNNHMFVYRTKRRLIVINNTLLQFEGVDYVGIPLSSHLIIKHSASNIFVLTFFVFHIIPVWFLLSWYWKSDIH